jgi:hypothetical protein
MAGKNPAVLGTGQQNQKKQADQKQPSPSVDEQWRPTAIREMVRENERAAFASSLQNERAAFASSLAAGAKLDCANGHMLDSHLQKQPSCGCPVCIFVLYLLCLLSLSVSQSASSPVWEGR